MSLLANKYLTSVHLFASLFVVAVFVGFALTPPVPVFADGHCTTIAIDIGATDEDPNTPGTQVCSTGDDVKTNVIYIYLKAIINFLAIGVGLAVAISIAIGGFGYITSEGNPQKLSAAKNRLFHAVVALLLFILMYSLLQFLIPGGLT
jgi:hypothetical protein